jgi:protein-tyrosine phosphatase
MDWFDALPPTQVTDRLWLSNYYVASQLHKNNPYGIKAILDVSDALEAAKDDFDDWLDSDEDEKLNSTSYTVPRHVTYLHVPFPDGHAIPEDCFWKCMKFLRRHYEKGDTIMVHCIAGISRSPTIMASFMHHHLGWDFEQALQKLAELRPVVNPAVATKVSAKKALKVWPYNVEGYQQPEDDSIWMDAELAAKAHPDPECPLRKFFLLANKLGKTEMANTPRHTIPCTCKRV